MAPFRVVHYAPLFHPHLGGAESHVRTLASMMPDVETTVLTNWLVGTVRRERVEAADVVRIGPSDSKVTRGLARRTDPIVDVIAAVTDVTRSVRKRRWLTRKAFDLLHVHAVYDVDALLRWDARLREPGLWRLAAFLNDFRQLGSPVVWTEHGLVLASERWGAASARLAQRLVSQYRNIICVEQKSYDLLTRGDHGPASKAIWLIPNGVRLDVFRPVDRSMGAPLRVGYASRLDKEGLRLLAGVASQLPEDMELVVAGAGQPAGGLPPELTCGKNVRLLGGVSHEDMPAFFAGIDVLLETHDLDIYGLAVIEAMACGRPVVRVKGAYRYPVVDGETGYLVEPTPRTLAETLTRLHEDPDTLRRLGRAARSVVERDFDARKRCAEVRAVYAEIAGL